MASHTKWKFDNGFSAIVDHESKYIMVYNNGRFVESYYYINSKGALKYLDQVSEWGVESPPTWYDFAARGKKVDAILALRKLCKNTETGQTIGIKVAKEIVEACIDKP